MTALIETTLKKARNFFFNVINHFGPEIFYSNFYVTNISCLGFKTKNNNNHWKNINYYDIPANIQEIFINHFIDEINIVNPTHIISCSQEVQKTLFMLKEKNKINCNIDLRLQHPVWCAYKKNYNIGFYRYIDTLTKFANIKDKKKN